MQLQSVHAISIWKLFISTLEGRHEARTDRKKARVAFYFFVVVVCFPQKTCLHLAKSRIYLTMCKEGGLPFV